MTVKGKVKLVSETIVVSEKFSKRDVVVTTNEQYPQDILVQFSQDKCALLDNINEGMEVDVHYNLRGREYNGKYYVSLDGWKIDSPNGAF